MCYVSKADKSDLPSVVIRCPGWKQVIHIVLGSLLNDHGCAVGFSGILFALKVVHNHTNPGGQTSYYGLRIANKYASWAELVIIQLIYPNASFLGHLSGIIAGFIYIQVVHPNLSVFNRSVSFVRTKLYNLVAKLNSRGYGNPMESTRNMFVSGPTDDHLNVYLILTTDLLGLVSTGALNLLAQEVRTDLVGRESKRCTAQNLATTMTMIRKLDQRKGTRTSQKTLLVTLIPMHFSRIGRSFLWTKKKN